MCQEVNGENRFAKTQRTGDNRRRDGYPITRGRQRSAPIFLRGWRCFTTLVFCRRRWCFTALVSRRGRRQYAAPFFIEFIQRIILDHAIRLRILCDRRQWRGRNAAWSVAAVARYYHRRASVAA